MDIEWLENLLVLSAVRSFSKTAQLRFVSQPALSRRIQSLEDWLGAGLIDRATVPLSLTPAGHNFRAVAAQIVRQASDARRVLGGTQGEHPNEIRFAVAHSLVSNFFPNWYRDALGSNNTFSSVDATNIMEGAQLLRDSQVDFFISYHHTQLPVLLEAERYPGLLLGVDTIRPFRATKNSSLLSESSSNWFEPLRYLAYSPGTFLGNVVDMILLNTATRLDLKQCFKTQMAEGIKAMVLAGHGVGWLPESCVQTEVQQGQVEAFGPDDLSLELEIKIFRSAQKSNPWTNDFWSKLSPPKRP